MSTSIDIINARMRRLERQKNAKDSIHVLHALGVLTDKDAQTKLNELNEEGIIGFTIMISGVKYNINGMSPSIDLDNIILPDGLGLYNGSARRGIILPDGLGVYNGSARRGIILPDGLGVYNESTRHGIIQPDGLGVYNESTRHGIICVEDAINENEESFSSWDEFETKIKSLLPEPTRCVVM